MRRRTAPRPFGFAVELAREQWAPETLLAEVQQVWPEAVGPAIAAEAQPVRERGGVVTVSCSAAVWAQELDLMSETIVERLNLGLDRGKIERLRCVALPVRGDV